jgi:hypothetical protein
MPWPVVPLSVFSESKATQISDVSFHKLHNSQTCVKKSPLGQRKSGLVRQVTS